MLMFGGGTCIFIILYRYISSLLCGAKDKNLSRAEQLQRIWSMEEGRVALIKYCEAEFSVENARAYDDLCKYKDVKDPEEKLKLANHIYNAYVGSSSSLLLVNSSQSCRSNITEKMLKLPNDNASALETLFDDFEVEVRSNLQDTFSRFMYSEQYAMYKRKRSSFDRAVKKV
jgi:hypothetical protein